MNEGAWRLRFRFRVEKSLNLPGGEFRFDFGGRSLVLSAAELRSSLEEDALGNGPEKERKLAGASWLAIDASGFTSRDEALAFGQRLRLAAEIAATSVRLGLNAGADIPSLGLAPSIVNEIRTRSGFVVRGGVHGLDVFPDEPNVLFLSGQIDLSVLHEPEQLFDTLRSLGARPTQLSERAHNAVILLNAALTSQVPIAQIVNAVSAVEMLGQDSKWSAAQVRLLQFLANWTPAAFWLASSAERREISAALIGDFHRVSLRRGVLRMLPALGLQELKGPWDGLYDERSKLMHASATRRGADHSELAYRSITLCGRIILTYVAHEVPEAALQLDRVYPAPS